MIARIPAVIAGLWLMAAPAVLDHREVAADNDRTFGPIVACLAFVAIWEVVRPLRWATAPFGLWLTVAPFALGYDDALVTANSVACGLIVLATAPLQPSSPERYGGGWQAIRKRRPVRPGT